MKAKSYMILLAFFFYIVHSQDLLFVYSAQQQNQKQTGMFIGWSREPVKTGN